MSHNSHQPQPALKFGGAGGSSDEDDSEFEHSSDSGDESDDFLQDEASSGQHESESDDGSDDEALGIDDATELEQDVQPLLLRHLLAELCPCVLEYLDSGHIDLIETVQTAAHHVLDTIRLYRKDVLSVGRTWPLPAHQHDSADSIFPWMLSMTASSAAAAASSSSSAAAASSSSEPPLQHYVSPACFKVFQLLESLNSPSSDDGPTFDTLTRIQLTTMLRTLEEEADSWEECHTELENEMDEMDAALALAGNQMDMFETLCARPSAQIAGVRTSDAAMPAGNGGLKRVHKHRGHSGAGHGDHGQVVANVAPIGAFYEQHEEVMAMEDVEDDAFSASGASAAAAACPASGASSAAAAPSASGVTSVTRKRIREAKDEEEEEDADHNPGNPLPSASAALDRRLCNAARGEDDGDEEGGDEGDEGASFPSRRSKRRRLAASEIVRPWMTADKYAAAQQLVALYYELRAVAYAVADEAEGLSFDEALEKLRRLNSQFCTVLGVYYQRHMTRSKNLDDALADISLVSEIRQEQQRTDLTMDPRAFQHLVQEVSREFSTGMTFTPEAVEALQEACEAFLVDRFTSGMLNAVARGSMVLSSADFSPATHASRM